MILRIVQACAVLICLTVGTEAQIIDRSPTPPCTKTWTSATFYERLDAMPPEIIGAFATLLGESKNPRESASWIAVRDGEWRAGDVMMPGMAPNAPILRFIYGLHSGNRWIVWYEEGGFARGDHVVAFDSGPNLSQVTLHARWKGMPEDICAVTYPFLAATTAPDDGSKKQ